MTRGNPSRRAVIGALTILPVPAAIMSAPAMGGGAPSPFSIIYARHRAVADAFNARPSPACPAQEEAETRAYCESVRAVDEAEPTNWTEFVQKLEHVLTPCDDDLSAGIVADAKRLLAVRS